MNVLFVSSGKGKNKPGIIVRNQAQSLSDKGIIINYFIIRGKGLISYILSVWPLYSLLKKNKFDIIHSHYYLSSIIATIALFIKAQHKPPHVVSLMGSDSKLTGLNRFFVRFLSRKIWSATIVKSKSMAIDLSLINPLIIPNGVDYSTVINKDIQKKRKNGKTILFGADPSRDSKNFNLAQKAVSLLNNPTVTLKVVYSVTHEKIVSEINESDLVLSTSKWEGSPNLIKEAMACNKPIVATDVGDIAWLFGIEPGHFLTGFDPEDVAKKITQALDFVASHGLTNGRKRIIELGLDAETVAKRLVIVYQTVLVKNAV